MQTTRNQALIALIAAGLLWGTSVPLSKAALADFGPTWLTVIRFTIAGLILMLVFRRRRWRNVRPALVLSGVLGYGACITLQNFGLGRTSVTHAALLIGAVPVIVAVMAVFFDRARVTALAWSGFALSLVGIVVVAGAGGGGATLLGDALVLLSVIGGAAFTIVQARLLPGQDVIAVSAAQFLASAAVFTPVAVVLEGVPTGSPADWSVPTSALLAVAALATAGTVLPYTLFAIGQTGVAPQVAGVFLNLETLVAALIGIALFAEPFGIWQTLGAAALLVGIYLSTGPTSRPATELSPGLHPVSDPSSAPELLEQEGIPVLELEKEQQAA